MTQLTADRIEFLLNFEWFDCKMRGELAPVSTGHLGLTERA
jgi:hypothetical protein